MVVPGLADSLRTLQLRTKKMLYGSFLGGARTAVRGSGFDFDQLRMYTPGDDVRFIDWKSSARSQGLLVKEYVEERNRTIWLLVDCSSSTLFAPQQGLLVYELIAQLTTVFAMLGDMHKDRVGVLLFSDRVEAVLPPGNGDMHIQRIVQLLSNQEITFNKKTALADVLRAAMNIITQKSLVVLLSDLLADRAFERPLRQLAQRHEVVVLRCMDQQLSALPSVGLLTMEDSETGERMEIDTSGQQMLGSLLMRSLRQEQERICSRAGVDLLSLNRAQDGVMELIKFFKRRMVTYRGAG